MFLINALYKKSFICRYDKDGIIPYLSYEDFPNLNMDEKSFLNSRGNEIHYFKYFYKEHEQKDTIIFCPGIGAGHTAYLREIEEFARRGYVVYSLDYTGCDKSTGRNMVSIYEPTRDVNELIDLLNIKSNLIVIGHSLGGFTALNISRLRKDIKKTVCMSAFISFEKLLKQIIKNKIAVNSILKYENRMNKEIIASNIDYLKNTKDSLLFIHSKDDKMVNYSDTIDEIEELNNKNIKIYKTDNKGHNPDYSLEAVQYMVSVFSEYNMLVKSKKLKTYEQKKAYMSDKSAFKMTELDQEVIEVIMEYIK